MINKKIASKFHPALLKELELAVLRAGAKADVRNSIHQWRALVDQTVLSFRRKMFETGIIPPGPLLLCWAEATGQILVVEGCLCCAEDAREFGATHFEQVWPLGPCDGMAEKLWPNGNDEIESSYIVAATEDYNVN